MATSRTTRSPSRTCAWTASLTRRGAASGCWHLRGTEFLLLEMFLCHAGRVLTRSAIFEHVWGDDLGATSNSLGVYMGYLRRKTEAGEKRRLLHTVRGIGYVLRERA